MIARQRIIGLAVAAIAGIGVIGGVLYWRHDARPRIDPDDKTQVAQGQSFYVAQCARCHGANLSAVVTKCRPTQVNE
jgi:mono/diheme cytochrome c family protein